jgi:hypothetical protein
VQRLCRFGKAQQSCNGVKNLKPAIGHNTLLPAAASSCCGMPMASVRLVMLKNQRVTPYSRTF